MSTIHAPIDVQCARRRSVIAAAGWLTLCRVLVHCLPFAWVVWYLRRPRRWRQLDPETAWKEARGTARAVQSASRRVPWRPRCLERALAARLMLARRGIRSRLCLGVGHNQSHQLRAHAWLQVAGRTALGRAGQAGLSTVLQIE